MVGVSHHNSSRQTSLQLCSWAEVQVIWLKQFKGDTILVQLWNNVQLYEMPQSTVPPCG